MPVNNHDTKQQYKSRDRNRKHRRRDRSTNRKVHVGNGKFKGCSYCCPEISARTHRREDIRLECNQLLSL
jgi:hypothetical protein